VVAILDQYGNPIRRETLTEPQTARVGALHSEWETHPVRGLTPAKLARILEDAEQGDLVAQADLAEDMEEKDGHILAELGKRKRAILTLDWDIQPPRDATRAEEEDAAWVREVLLDMPDFDDLLLDLLDAISKGYSCAEIAWGRQGREWLPERIEHRPARWFTVDRETRSELRLRTGGLDGEPLQPFGWIVHLHKAKSGYLARGGLVRTLVWPFLFKNYSVRDLAEFLEIYGLPLRLGTYPTGASDEEKATLLRAVVNIGHAAAGIIPEGMAIEFKEAAKGNKDPFEAMIDWCERTQSKAILGGTLTSQADGKTSTNALGNVHNEVRHDLLVSDARQLAGTLTRDLVYPLLALNRGVDSLRRCPRFVFDTAEPEDLKPYAEALPRLVPVGARIPERWVRERLRIPKPEGDEPVLAMPGAPAVAGMRAECPHCRGVAALKMDGEPDHPADQIADRMARDARPAMAEWLAEIEAMLEAAENLAQFREMLLAAYGDLPEERTAQVMAAGIAVAEAAGRFDIENAGWGRREHTDA